MEKQDKIPSVFVPEEIKNGRFAIETMITHSSDCFILDALAFFPGMQRREVISRVIISPQHAKRLEKILAENIRHFEEKFGTIKDEPHKLILPLKPDTKNKS